MTNKLTASMHRVLFQELKVSPTQEIPCLIQDIKLHWSIIRSLPLFSTQSQIYWIHTILHILWVS
jgi:hypothetical protein